MWSPESVPRMDPPRLWVLWPKLLVLAGVSNFLGLLEAWPPFNKWRPNKCVYLFDAFPRTQMNLCTLSRWLCFSGSTQPVCVSLCVFHMELSTSQLYEVIRISIFLGVPWHFVICVDVFHHQIIKGVYEWSRFLSSRSNFASSLLPDVAWQRGDCLWRASRELNAVKGAELNLGNWHSRPFITQVLGTDVLGLPSLMSMMLRSESATCLWTIPDPIIQCYP